MSANDVFNPNTGFDTDLGFNANWNYGSPRKTAANFVTQRPKFGIWATRSVGSGGYTFDLTFVDRPIEQVRYIRKFYEQYQTGFFTLIDHDNGGRNHVGRFTSYSDDTQTANVKYTVRVTFEDVPGAPMITYPSDFDATGHTIYAVDDFVQASNGIYNALIGTSGARWAFQQQPSGGSTSDPSTYEAICTGAMNGDFAVMEYVGWGFQLPLRCDPAFGQVGVYVDEMLAVQGLSLFDAVTIPVYAFLAPNVTLTPNLFFHGDLLQSISVSILGLPLGRHRVKVVAGGGYSPGSTGSTIAMQQIQVIH